MTILHVYDNVGSSVTEEIRSYHLLATSVEHLPGVLKVGCMIPDQSMPNAGEKMVLIWCSDLWGQN